MASQDFQTITLSHATYVGPSGATAAATYSFFSSDYQPPVQERYSEYDIVKNQNGKFKHLYDNGPGFFKWAPFKLNCGEAFTELLGATAGQQFDNIKNLWNHPGVMGMRAPEATYLVHWSNDMERSFRVFPRRSADIQEFIVVVQFEEGQ